MSEGRRDEDLSAIAWPGFVDILSAVIIMFVFFIMIVATALFFHIIIYKSKVKSDIAVEQVQSDQQFEFSQRQTEFAESESQTYDSDTEKKELVIYFAADAISLLPEVKEGVEAELRTYLDPNNPDRYEIIVEASKPLIGLGNIVRKIATARMLNVRNVIMAAGFTPESITPRIIGAESLDGQIHWVRIRIVDRNE